MVKSTVGRGVPIKVGIMPPVGLGVSVNGVPPGVMVIAGVPKPGVEVAVGGSVDEGVTFGVALGCGVGVAWGS